MRTSTSSTPNPASDLLASLLIRFMIWVRSFDSSVNSGASPRTLRRLENTIGSSRPRNAASLSTDWRNAQRIGDAVAGEGVDHEPLLVAQDQLDRRRVEIEHALVEILDLLDERHLEVQARVLDDVDRVAELQHQRLLGLMDGEQRR